MPSVPFNVFEKGIVLRHQFSLSHAPSPIETVMVPHDKITCRMRCIDAWIFLTNSPAPPSSIQVWTGPGQTGEKLCEFDCNGVDGYSHVQVKMHATGCVDPQALPGDADALYLYRSDAVLDGEICLLFQRERVVP